MNASGFIAIAIDGGAASGKSTTARALAERLNLLHVDTGAHYRAVTAALLEAGVGPDEPEAVEAALAKASLETRVEGKSARVVLNGQPPDQARLRSAAVNRAVSAFAALPKVRAFLREYQRAQMDVARERGFAGLVMEGRDIGTVILPDAPYRFFLQADPETRAERRRREGQDDAVASRDQSDSSRATAPLARAPGAVVVDTARLDPEATVAFILEHIERHGCAGHEAGGGP
jgi:cytidylate kinase